MNIKFNPKLLYLIKYARTKKATRVTQDTYQTQKSRYPQNQVGALTSHYSFSNIV